jgi:hypothetical protein
MPEPIALPPATEVTGPGVYNLPEAEYHARPELSSTGARRLLPPSCPALFKHWLDEGGETKPAWEKGKAAHKLVLGAGPGIVAVEDEWGQDPNAWRTDKVKEKLAEIRGRGDVPLKKADYDAVHAMAAAIRKHPVAAALLDPATGAPEQALIWRDERTGVMCRALVDFLKHPVAGKRFLLTDYKHAGGEYGASPEKVGRTMGDFGYHVQLAWYLMGCVALGLCSENQAAALLIVQESRKPYLVTVAQPDPTAMRMGAIRCRQALDLYAECIKNDRWPGYADDVVLAELPPWETRELNGAIW